jgi:polysaccharide deacetylase 2 family uncharacterized protein YibQ
MRLQAPAGRALVGARRLRRQSAARPPSSWLSVLRSLRRLLPCLLLGLASAALNPGLAADVSAVVPPPAAEHTPRIAIIIDDIGQALQPGLRAVRLPGPVAIAVLPHLPYSRQLAGAAHGAGKEVMLHLPMQSLQLRAPIGPGGVYLDTMRLELRETLDAALASVPHAVGINNHMGSLVTRHPGLMRWLMEELTDRQPLYWVDSRTTPDTVALQQAHALNVPAQRRDVFLDNEPTAAAVAQQFERLLEIARSRGSAVAIGHPHAATLAFLAAALPGLERAGIRLVPPSELVQRGPETRQAHLSP